MKRYAVLLGLPGLVLLALYLVFRNYSGSGLPDTLGDSPNAPGATLPRNVAEQIVIDPRKHTMVFKRNGKTVVMHLPDKQTVITLKESGQILVASPQWGLEVRPFIGLGFSTDAHFGIGLDGVYWRRFDVGGGIRWNFGLTDPRFFLALTYNMKDNLRIGITIDHKKAPGLMLSLRI